MDPPARPLAHLPELFQQGLTIRVIRKDRFSAISAIQSMSHWSFKLPARFSIYDRLAAIPFLRSACPTHWKPVQHREKTGSSRRPQKTPGNILKPILTRTLVGR